MFWYLFFLLRSIGLFNDEIYSFDIQQSLFGGIIMTTIFEFPKIFEKIINHELHLLLQVFFIRFIFDLFSFSFPLRDFKKSAILLILYSE